MKTNKTTSYAPGRFICFCQLNKNNSALPEESQQLNCTLDLHLKVKFLPVAKQIKILLKIQLKNTIVKIGDKMRSNAVFRSQDFIRIKGSKTTGDLVIAPMDYALSAGDL